MKLIRFELFVVETRVGTDYFTEKCDVAAFVVNYGPFTSEQVEKLLEKEEEVVGNDFRVTVLRIVRTGNENWDV